MYVSIVSFGGGSARDLNCVFFYLSSPALRVSSRDVQVRGRAMCQSGQDL